MDNKRSSFILMLVTMALIFAFLQYQQYIRRKNDMDKPPASTQAPGGNPAPQTAQSGTAPATQGTAQVGWGVMPAPASTPAPEAAVLGSAAKHDATYALQLNVNPHRAALSSVVLNQFGRADDFQKPESKRGVYTYQERVADVPEAEADPLATRSVTVNGAAVSLDNVIWTREPQATTAPTTGPAAVAGAVSATYSTTLVNNGTPALKISKTYTVYPINSPQGSSGYEVRMEYGLKNLTASPLNVGTEFNGPVLPPPEGGRGADRQILGGYRADNNISVAFHPVEEFKKDKQETLDLTKNDKSSLAWVGPCSVYFNALVLPLNTDPNAKGDAAVGNFIEKVTAKAWQLGNNDVRPDEKPVTLTFQTKAQALGPNQSVSLPMDVYFGPKWRKVLDTPYYAASPRHYDATLVLKSGMCGYCAFDWLIKLMVVLLTAFHWLAGGFAGHGDWGIAIIMLVGVVRLMLHPITKRSQVQMMKFGKMAPEIERLKKKYADDKDELNRQMMIFYKENGAGQILGCLPMFLQTPIWIALYSALQTTFELRQSPFLWNLTWIHDLSKADFLIDFHRTLFTIPLIGMPVQGLNLLPLLLGLVYFFQQKYLTPTNPAMTEQQLQQQKMMQVITPVLFPLFMYSLPSGLNLYIFTSTLFGLIESKVIRKHIKEREEAEKAERVIVDAKPTRQSKRQQSRREPTAEAPKGGVRGWLAELQSKVEEARREQERGRKK